MARCCFFGDDIFQVSTLREKGNRCGHDPHKLKSLITKIHGQAFRHMNQEDFTTKIQQKVEHALQDYLKPNRSVNKGSSSDQKALVPPMNRGGMA